MNPALIPILVLVLALAFDVFCLVDLSRTARVQYLPKWGWAIVICVISAPFGGLVYLTVGKVR